MTRRRTQLVFLIVIGLLPGLVAADEREDADRKKELFPEFNDTLELPKD
jgi:hypothetical protein